ncbi:hypothetical protein ACSBR1_017824 [Camellia fascicularis]
MIDDDSDFQNMLSLVYSLSVDRVDMTITEMGISNEKHGVRELGEASGSNITDDEMDLLPMFCEHEERTLLSSKWVNGITHVDQYKLTITYNHAWLGVKKARTTTFEDFSMSYDAIGWYMDIMMSTNPGSYLQLDYTHQSGRFKRFFFIAFNASIQGFRHCHSLLFIDGTFLRGKYKDTLLTATTKNGDQVTVDLLNRTCLFRKNLFAWEEEDLGRLHTLLNQFLVCTFHRDDQWKWLASSSAQFLSWLAWKGKLKTSVFLHRIGVLDHNVSGLQWVGPATVDGLLHWWSGFKWRKLMHKIWRVMPLAIMWSTWRFGKLLVYWLGGACWCIEYKSWRSLLGMDLADMGAVSCGVAGLVKDLVQCLMLGLRPDLLKFKACYAASIYPIPTVEKPLVAMDDLVVFPLICKKPPGRPRKNRIPSRGEKIRRV